MKLKKALESMFAEFKKKYEFEIFYNDLDGFFSVNKLVQKLVKNSISLWKERSSFLDTVIAKTMLACFLVTDSYLLLKLLELNKWELLTEFIISLDSDHGNNDEDISVPIKTLLIVSAYLANLSRKGNFSDIKIDKIMLLGTLNIRKAWKIYFEEYCKVIKVFVDEEGDEDILLLCSEKIKGTSLDMLRVVIYIY